MKTKHIHWFMKNLLFSLNSYCSYVPVVVQYGANEDKEGVDVKFKCFMFDFSLVENKLRLYNPRQWERRVLHNELWGHELGERALI